MRNILLMLTFALSLCSCHQKGLLDQWKALPLSRSTDFGMLEQQIALNPTEWEAALRFLRESDLAALPLGRSELTPGGTYYNVQEYETKLSGDFEAHEAYVDVQVVVSGKEQIVVAPLGALSQKRGPYSPQTDAVFFGAASDQTVITASSECIAVFFPTDGHKPGMALTEPQKVRKIVVKIPFR